MASVMYLRDVPPSKAHFPIIAAYCFPIYMSCLWPSSLSKRQVYKIKTETSIYTLQFIVHAMISKLYSVVKYEEISIDSNSPCTLWFLSLFRKRLYILVFYNKFTRYNLLDMYFFSLEAIATAMYSNWILLQITADLIIWWCETRWYGLIYCWFRI